MSRRHQSRHLERGQVVADQVAEVIDSRGDCPGPCNAAYRRLRQRWESEVTAEYDKLRKVHVDATPVYVMEMAQARVRSVWEEAGRAARPPRPGVPVWCHRCTAEIRRALDRLPGLLGATLTLGDSPAARPDGSLVTDPVVVVSSSEPTPEGLVVDVLACGHRRTRPDLVGPLPLVVCSTCVATAMVPEPGRLAPPERAGRRGARQPVSPAGSPAWVEADAAIQWVCSTADQVRYRLDAARDERFPWRTGSTSDRVAAATRAARSLVARLEVVLALPDPLPESIGRAARGVSTRLEQVSGVAVKEHALEDECPACDRRGLVQEDGASLVHCKACLQWWDQDHFEQLLADRGVSA